MKNERFLTHQEIYDQVVGHLGDQRRAALLPRGGGAYRGACGGCPIGHFIRPVDYSNAMEGVPVRYLIGHELNHPAYMDAGIAALRKALLKARINVYNVRTVALLSCLQNVHDVFGVWEWQDRLVSIAREFDLVAGQLKVAA